MTNEKLKQAADLHKQLKNVESRLSDLGSPELSTRMGAILYEIEQQGMLDHFAEVLLDRLKERQAQINKAIEQL